MHPPAQFFVGITAVGVDVGLGVLVLGSLGGTAAAAHSISTNGTTVSTGQSRRYAAIQFPFASLYHVRSEQSSFLPTTVWSMPASSTSAISKFTLGPRRTLASRFTAHLADTLPGRVDTGVVGGDRVEVGESFGGFLRTAGAGAAVGS